MKATINVSKEHIDGIIKSLDDSRYFLLDNSNTSRADLFNFALALGLNDGNRTPLSSSVGFIRTSYVESILYQYKSVFFAKDLSGRLSEIDEITDTDKALLLIEEYANTGFLILKKMKNEFEDDSHFMEKLLNEMERVWKKYFDTNGLGAANNELPINQENKIEAGHINALEHQVISYSGNDERVLSKVADNTL